VLQPLVGLCAALPVSVYLSFSLRRFTVAALSMAEDA